MPRRTQRTYLTAAAVAVLSIAATPATAQAGLLKNFFKQRAAKTSSSTTTVQTNAEGKTTAIVTTANATNPAPTSEQVTSPAVPAPSNCQELPTTKAFQGVDGDDSDYSIAPAGDFESGGAGWTLTGGARVVSGNETLGVSGGSKSLQLPLGSTATSPAFCVDESHPHFRFAYKVDNAVLAGFVAYVLFRDANGNITNMELVSSKTLALTPSAWQASPKSPLATIIPLSATNRSATVQLKLLSLSPTDFVNDVGTTIIGQNAALDTVTKVGGGAANLVASITGALGAASNQNLNIGTTVDSVMVDPYRRR